MDGATPFCRERNMNRRSKRVAGHCEHHSQHLALHLAAGAGLLGWSSPSLERVDRRCCGVRAFNCFACAVPEMSETGLVEAMRRIDAEGTDRPQRRLRDQGG
jgi:hypothetical protein